MAGNHVGTNLAAMRVHKQETGETLGRALGISPDLIRRWEEGVEGIPPYRLVELAVLLDCKIMDFFVRSPEVEYRSERVPAQV